VNVTNGSKVRTDICAYMMFVMLTKKKKKRHVSRPRTSKQTNKNKQKKQTHKQTNKKRLHHLPPLEVADFSPKSLLPKSMFGPRISGNILLLLLLLLFAQILKYRGKNNKKKDNCTIKHKKKDNCTIKHKKKDNCTIKHKQNIQKIIGTKINVGTWSNDTQDPKKKKVKKK